ncbi:MAG TPA: alpha/beta hydrolase [Devosia sp.]|nr:alpha/beta hydrolase [Devosia sp.]
MPKFRSSGIEIAYEVYGEGPPILLIHGFASSGIVNWVNPGWVDTLNKAGRQAITIDNRGHGGSQKFYDPKLYLAHDMADDAARLLDHLGIERLPILGYSMGARICAYLAVRHPQRVTCSVWGGMGGNLLTGMDDSEAIAAGLTSEEVPAKIGSSARQFRLFADSSKADRAALAACVVTSREPMEAEDVRRIASPVLVAIGESDEMAGGFDPLPALLADCEIFVIPRRNHMLSTGDPKFKSAALAFLERHAPLPGQS